MGIRESLLSNRAGVFEDYLTPRTSSVMGRAPQRVLTSDRIPFLYRGVNQATFGATEGAWMTKLQSERIDESLPIRNGRLFVEECDAADMAHRFGTPLYVVSEDQLRRNIRRFRRAFAERWLEGPVNILASAKANFTLALLGILAQEGAGCDAFGPGELHAALQAGIPAESISVNGSTKSMELIDLALRSGARITLDSRAETNLVREVARALGIRAKVCFFQAEDGIRDLTVTGVQTCALPI